MINAEEINVSDIKNIQQYIDLLSSSKNNMIKKISEIELEYKNKLEVINNLCTNNSELQNLLTKPTLTILECEVEIIKILTKYTLQNKSLDYRFFLTVIKALYKLSECLRNRLRQKEILHPTIEKDGAGLQRCSYKFCFYHANCAYNYNKNPKILCYQDHYVHNMVSADINILIQYIDKYLNKEIDTIHSKEILKSINTLSYVICHMEKELKTKCLYLPQDKWEQYHIFKVNK